LALTAMILLLVVVVGGFYVSRNPEHDALTDAARAGVPGKFVQLEDGVTHYLVDGPDSGRTIVLVHGFSVPAYIWDSTAAFLAGAGYRVVRYDEYGRGWSDRPNVEYDAGLYDRQISQLLDSLHVAGPVDIAGVSMGGWVSATFAAHHPDRVRSLVLVDPVAGTSPRNRGLFYYPVIGPYLWQTLAMPTMAEGQTSDFVAPQHFPNWVDRYRVQMRYRGFGRALLSTERNTAGLSMDSVYRGAARAGRPVLLLWGTADRTVPFAHSASVRADIPAAEFHPIDGAAHLPILEQARRTDWLMLDFLGRHGG
jgi:pimeloyl-ACP methyl ester carboxylesterase